MTTSRRELPPVVLPGTRRFLPLGAVELLAPTFSFVLDASDLESSGGGLDLGGAMSRDEIYRILEEYILVESRGFAAMGHLATRGMRGRGRSRFPSQGDKLHDASGDTLIRAETEVTSSSSSLVKSPLPSSFSIINTR